MRLLLGLFFFSVFLATGNSLSCETCESHGSVCSGSKMKCPPNHNVCMTVMGERTDVSPKSLYTWKGCTWKDSCKLTEKDKGKPLTLKTPDIEFRIIIKQVTCSKAPPSFASFFPAFLGLLLMKLLF